MEVARFCVITTQLKAHLYIRLVAFAHSFVVETNDFCNNAVFYYNIRCDGIIFSKILFYAKNYGSFKVIAIRWHMFCQTTRYNKQAYGTDWNAIEIYW